MSDTTDRNATIRARIATGESLTVVARDYGISRQRVHQLTRYVCRDHPETVLADVRSIRADIYRPEGALVVGECAGCNEGRKGRVLSYGRNPPAPAHREPDHNG